MKHKRSTSRPTNRAQLRGLSLIELMVALALGVVLILGLTQVFGSVRASFGAADGMSRLQENARFGLQFIRDDLRMAGHLGCGSSVNSFGELALFNRLGGIPVAAPPAQAWVSRVHTNLFEPAGNVPPYVFQIHRPIEVYDYAGTSPGDVLAVGLEEFPDGEGDVDQFRPALPDRLTLTSADLGTTGLLGNNVGDLVPGSDFFVIRYLRDHEPLLEQNGGTLPGDVDKGNWVLQGSNAIAAALPPWTVWGFVKCGVGVTLMQIDDQSPRRAQVGGSLNQWTEWFGGAWSAESDPSFRAGDLAFRYEFAIYHVGRTGDDTPPALFRRRLLINPGNSNAAQTFGPPEELVPGVEMMQVLVGVDTEQEDATCAEGAAAPADDAELVARIRNCSGDDTVDTFRSPREHIPDGLTPQELFQRQLAIRSVRVSLLVRSPERLPATAAPVVNTVTVGDVQVTPPADGRLRHVYDSTITIRNRVRN